MKTEKLLSPHRKSATGRLGGFAFCEKFVFCVLCLVRRVEERFGASLLLYNEGHLLEYYIYNKT
jgi:hypothetical protein